jgi:hypothetical protein
MATLIVATSAVVTVVTLAAESLLLARTQKWRVQGKT